jgi:hypothetical protein
MEFLKGLYKYVQDATLRISIQVQLTSSVAVQLSHAGPTYESDGDSTVVAPYFHSHYDRKMTRIRRVISSII